jgi:hypothetical protein
LQFVICQELDLPWNQRDVIDVNNWLKAKGNQEPEGTAGILRVGKQPTIRLSRQLTGR